MHIHTHMCVCMCIHVYTYEPTCSYADARAAYHIGRHMSSICMCRCRSISVSAPVSVYMMCCISVCAYIYTHICMTTQPDACRLEKERASFASKRATRFRAAKLRKPPRQLRLSELGSVFAFWHFGVLFVLNQRNSHLKKKAYLVEVPVLVHTLV